MISRANIKIFDYLFNVDCNSNSINLIKFINELFQSKNDDYIKFILENKNIISNSQLLVSKTMDGYSVTINEFPKLNFRGTSEYLNYKKGQFEKILNDNPNYNFEHISDDLNLNNKALKKVIDFLIDNNVIKCEKEYATMNILGTYDFEFDNLKINNNINDINNHKFMQNININVNGNKNKISKNDFSNNKKEIKRKSIVDKIIEILKHILKIN